MVHIVSNARPQSLPSSTTRCIAARPCCRACWRCRVLCKDAPLRPFRRRAGSCSSCAGCRSTHVAYTVPKTSSSWAYSRDTWTARVITSEASCRGSRTSTCSKRTGSCSSRCGRSKRLGGWADAACEAPSPASSLW
eukprot:scaffold4942_cov417-Prasinococcus_capsulatus_cf.AAC.6